MTFMIERLTELRRHLEHLRALEPRVKAAADLERDLSLHNDVMFSLLTVVQLVIDISGEVCARNGLRFSDYTQAVRNLSQLPDFSAELVDRLAPLPGFRNVMLHEYVSFDLSRAVAAMRDLAPVDEFLRIVSRLEAR
jgi:uncharacterized protein YutE (UPF0331/DUF86 family)